jgi:hypothetical protein
VTPWVTLVTLSLLTLNLHVVLDFSWIRRDLKQLWFILRLTVRETLQARRGKTLLVMSNIIFSMARPLFLKTFQHHHHLHPQKWAYTAHSQGQLLFVTIITITTGSSWPTLPHLWKHADMLIFKDGCFLPTPPLSKQECMLFLRASYHLYHRHSQKQEYMIIFEGCLPPLPPLPSKMGAVFEGCLSPLPPLFWKMSIHVITSSFLRVFNYLKLI